jgi:hypothetical protein
MSEIDRQRIAAVRTLKTLGYTYRDGQWKPPLHASRGITVVADAMHARLVAIADKIAANLGIWTDDDLEAIGESLEGYEAVRWPDGKAEDRKR